MTWRLMGTWLVLSVILLVWAMVARGATSRANRDDSLLFVGVSPFGVTAPHILGTLAGDPYLPLSVGVYLGKNLLLAGEYGAWGVDVEGEGDDDPDFSGDFQNIGLYARWFPGTNSFNILAAVRQRTWDVDAEVTITDESSGADRRVAGSLEADALVGAVGLGNQWITDFGLTIGMDWFVVGGLVDSSTNAKIDAGELGTLSPAEVAETEKELEDAGDTLNTISGLPGFLVLTVGWSF